MLKFNIYAPSDGIVKDISCASDETFAQKLLGDGIVFIPEANDFYCPFDAGEVISVFETKHAILIKEQTSGLTFLMHIGIDTVNLKGVPFDIKVSAGDIVTKHDQIADVDLQYITNHNLSTETPIVFENREQKFTIQNLVTDKPVKCGAVIGEIIINETATQEVLAPESQKPTIASVTQQLHQLVGTQSNYAKVYNCMTRLRFVINDKALVQVAQIKKLPDVKGINWSGNELQVIIGGNAYKFKDSFDQQFKQQGPIETKQKTKLAVKQKFINAVGGIMMPIIPVLMASGLLVGIRAILVQSGVLDNPNKPDQILQFLQQTNFASGFMYVICQLALTFIAIFFCVNTVVYLKGNVGMGVFIALTLANPFMFFGIHWKLFSLGSLGPVYVEPYYSSVLPLIAAGYLYVYCDRWVKRWMPATVDVVFRSFLCYVATILLMFFVCGPILKIVENLLASFLLLFDQIPFGLGAMMFAFLWQILVLTGLHVAVVLALTVVVSHPDTTSVLYGATVLGGFGQLGVAIGVALITKDNKTRQVCLGGIPAAIFGITEPLIYGVNLPKIRPFFLGCCSAGLAALIVGIFGFTSYTPGALGIFGFTRFVPGGVKAVVLFAIGSVLTIIFAIGLMFLFYKERLTEKQAIKKVNQQVIKLVNLYLTQKQLPKTNLKKLLQDNVYALTKDDLANLKQYEKLLYQESSLTAKINSWQLKFAAKKQNQAKIISKIEKLKDVLKQNQHEIDRLINSITTLRDNFIDSVNQTLTILANKFNMADITDFNINYLHAIYGLEVALHDKVLPEITINHQFMKQVKQTGKLGAQYHEISQ